MFLFLLHQSFWYYWPFCNIMVNNHFINVFILFGGKLFYKIVMTFCHTSRWISPRYICVTPILNPCGIYFSTLSCVVPKLDFGFPTSYINLKPLIYFTYVNVYIPVLFSKPIAQSSSPTESRSLFFISVSYLLPCR